MCATAASATSVAAMPARIGLLIAAVQTTSTQYVFRRVWIQKSEQTLMLRQTSTHVSLLVGKWIQPVDVQQLNFFTGYPNGRDRLKNTFSRGWKN
jgi:hypothetical protein